MDTPRWFPDELALAGAEHLGLAYAAGFEILERDYRPERTYAGYVCRAV